MGHGFWVYRDKISDPAAQTELLTTAARLDWSRTMPLIERLLKSSDENERMNGVTALTATERGDAIPVLVSLLKDPSLKVRQAAEGGLEDLTRRTPEENSLFWPSVEPALDMPFWERWLAENPSLPVYLARLCP